MAMGSYGSFSTIDIDKEIYSNASSFIFICRNGEIMIQGGYECFISIKECMQFAPPEVEESKCGDEYFYPGKETGEPQYKSGAQKWEICINWMKKIRDENIDDPKSAAVALGNELIKWAEQWDAYTLFILMRTRWTAFRNTFLTADAPPEMMELVEHIMYDKMTEEQMWGKKE